MILSEIYQYPVKSLAGIAMQSATLNVRGIEYDRHWMLVDQQGQFLSQRQLPKMVLIKTQFDGTVLTLSVDGQQIEVSINTSASALESVIIWGDGCQALGVSDEVDAWLSHFLETPCHMVYLPKNQIRQVDQSYAKTADQTGFADGFPLLLISQASLDDLNQRLITPIDMQRFRPNLVVKGCDAFAEDNWQSIQIGGIQFDLVKPCSRCVIPSIDPQTALKSNELLNVLAAYRRQGNQVMFGVNVLHRGLGRLSVGMDVIDKSMS